MQNDTEQRSQRFAKILNTDHGQALVFLQRDNSDDLQVIVQLWSRSSDHQVRALVQLDTDDQALVAFDSITEETIGDLIASSGMLEVL